MATGGPDWTSTAGEGGCPHRRVRRGDPTLSTPISRWAQRLQAKVVEKIIRAVKAQDGEIFGGLEDARDGDTGLGGVVERGGGGAAGETLTCMVRRGSKMWSGSEVMKCCLSAWARPRIGKKTSPSRHLTGERSKEARSAYA